MCEFKKKNDNEIIKCNIPTVEINNGQNIYVKIIKNDIK